MESDVVTRDWLVQVSGWASYAVICFFLTLMGACSNSLSKTPSTSNETLSESMAQEDQADGMASSFELVADQDFAANDGPLLTEGGADSFVRQDVDSLVFEQTFEEDASWVTLAWPLVDVEAFGEWLDQVSNLAILDLLAPPSQPPSRTFLEQSCINQGLPDIFCRQRYGP